MTILLAWLSSLAWGGLLLFRGMFWRVEYPRLCDEPRQWPKIVAIIPARNEEDHIGQTITSLLSHDYPGDLSIILTDDSSEDQTIEKARQAAQSISDGMDHLTIVHAPSLPEGWQGKMWAQQQGYLEALKTHKDADYFLLTDADIIHAPFELRRIIARMIHKNLDMSSLMVRLSTTHLLEKCLIPAFIFFFRLLYPFRWVSDPHKKTSGAAGGYIVIKSQILHDLEGFTKLSGELIDDCGLASLVKKKGGRITLDLADDTTSSRHYKHASDLWMVIARSAFSQLEHSNLLLVATIVTILIVLVLPPWLFIFFPHSRAIAFTAWIEMAFAYAPIIAYSRLPFYWAYTLPFAAIFYLGATIDSARRHWRGNGGLWKGRHSVQSILKSDPKQ
jgi:hopene-associated glycosyltransferase HpnB